ncbi:MAG: SAM-dependent chlorinase/fluorinase [Syntrophobacteraceae bacterium]
MAAPIITLLTDFGLRDGYVASMKGVILGIAPDAAPVDISHLIAPQDVRSAAFVLFTCYECFPHRTVHLAVVDPGVGTDRGAIAVRAGSFFLVGPDNGIFSLVLRKETGWRARSLENTDFHRQPASATFHGRDIFAPVAAHLARGAPFEALGPECAPAISEWASPIRTAEGIEGEVIHIDRFGNAVTNITREMPGDLGPSERWSVSAEKASGLPVLGAYGLAAAGSALALVGSSGFFEIAVNGGNAASELGLRPGSKVYFRA